MKTRYSIRLSYEELARRLHIMPEVEILSIEVESNDTILIKMRNTPIDYKLGESCYYATNDLDSVVDPYWTEREMKVQSILKMSTELGVLDKKHREGYNAYN